MGLLNKSGDNYVSINNILPEKMSEMIKLNITNKRDGSTCEISYSVYTYIYRVFFKFKNDEEKLNNCLRSIYQFGEAANEFFSS